MPASKTQEEIEAFLAAQAAHEAEVKADQIARELELARQTMLRFINEYRNSLLNNFCAFDGKQWDCDETSKSNIMGANILAVLNGGNLPPGFIWRDYNNNDWDVTGKYMAQLAQAIGIFYNGCYHASWQHKEALLKLITIEDILNYDYTHTLWPDPTV